MTSVKLNISLKIRSAQNIKVLVLPGWYPSKRSPNNGDFVQYQVELLRKFGFHIDLIHADISIHNKENLLKTSRHSSISDQGLTSSSSHWSIPRRGKIGMKLWRRTFIREVERYLKRYGHPDIIHAHTYLGAWVAKKIKEQHGINYIVSEHSTQVLNQSLSPTHDKIARIAYKEASQVLAVSHQLSNVIRDQFNVQPSVLPNFIDTELFEIDLNKTSKGLPLKIICVGELIPRKRIDHLIQACARLEIPYVLTIVGDGPELESLQNLARRLDVKAKFSGRKTQEELSQLLSQQDVLVHPSKSETFGIVLIEAMACGLPVISYRNGGAEDIITAETGILLEKDGIDQLSHAIKTIYQNYESYHPENIRHHVLNNYSIKAIAQQLIPLYTSLAG